MWQLETVHSLDSSPGCSNPPCLIASNISPFIISLLGFPSTLVVNPTCSYSPPSPYVYHRTINSTPWIIGIKVDHKRTRHPLSPLQIRRRYHLRPKETQVLLSHRCDIDSTP